MENRFKECVNNSSDGSYQQQEIRVQYLEIVVGKCLKEIGSKYVAEVEIQGSQFCKNYNRSCFSHLIHDYS